MKDDRLYLHHMLERCHRITRFTGSGRETFMASEELQDAVIRNVEVIGEAAKRVSAEARGHLPSLDWNAICGPRDVLIHDYIGVDLDEVWNVAFFRVPELQAMLEATRGPAWLPNFARPCLAPKSSGGRGRGCVADASKRRERRSGRFRLR